MQVNPFTDITWPTVSINEDLNHSCKKEISKFLRKYQDRNLYRTPDEYERFLKELDEKSLQDVKTASFVFLSEDSADGKCKRVAEILCNTDIALGNRDSAEPIWLVHNLSKGQSYAQKKIDPTRKKEIEILTLLSKQTTPIEGVYQVYRVIPIDTFVLAMGHVYHCDLEAFYKKKKPPFALNKWTVIQQLSHGLKWLHEQDIFHSDLKPKNVLVKEDGVVIADFDVAKRFGGTSYDISPGKAEVFLKAIVRKEIGNEQTKAYNEKYGKKDDIWAFGTVFAFVLNAPYKKTKESIAPLPCLKKTGTITEYLEMLMGLQESAVIADVKKIKCRDEERDLVLEMLNFDPDKRPDAATVSEKIDQALKLKA